MSEGRLSVRRLTVEHAENPLGVDTPRPRLAWTLAAEGHGALQRAYQVQVGELWDSGRVDSERSVGVEYAGAPLRPRTRYPWRVRVWDELGRPGPWSPTACWETGMLGSPWQARWIGAATGGPAPLLRREFGFDLPVAWARLYISGLGYYEAELNGRRVGRSVLDPGFTDYGRTVLYAVHDVADLVAPGANAIGVTLGRGFYGMSTPNAWRWHQAPWHGEPRLLALLEIGHPDGTATTVGTGSSWRVAPGPTLFDSLYEGETYDAALALPGWSAPGFDESAWSEPVLYAAPSARLRAQRHEPIEIVGSVRPVSVTRLPNGDHVADMGRTLAGWTRLTVDAPPGTEIRLQHGERLDPDGVQAANEHVPTGRSQQDRYLCAGGGPESWEPRFSYKGFRYVQVGGTTEPPELLGRIVHTNVREISTFRCSEPLYERLDAAMRRTVCNNLHGIPTDTPTYEKNGWTGDAQLGAPTMAAAFDMRGLFGKWLGDLADSQDERGQLPVIVPSGGWGYRELAPAPEWTTVYPFLARELYRWYGDERMLAEHWAPIARYLDWEIARMRGGLATTALGDYLAPGHPEGNPPEDTRLTATAYLYRGLRSAAELGELLGHTAAADRYRAVAGRCAAALNATFLGQDGHYRTGTDPGYRQTSNAIPLAFGLVPEWARESVLASLVADVRARGCKLNTGVLGTSVLLPVLTEGGYADVAHAVATQRGYPGWGHWLDNGADTMWERWDLDTRSRNHYFFGTVAQWLYEHVAGLRPGDAGYREFVVRPDARTGVDWAGMTTDTVRGPAAAEWSRTTHGLRLTVDVPVGATAEVHVPAERGAEVRADPRAELLRNEAGFAVFRAGHGRWSFTAERPLPAARTVPPAANPEPAAPEPAPPPAASAVPAPGPADEARRTLRERALVVAGGAAAALAVWVAAGPVAGLELTVRLDETTHRVDPWLVLAASVLGGLAGWGVLAALERFVPRARPVWTAVAFFALAVSLVAPVAVGATMPSKVVLVVHHLAVAAVVIPMFAGGRTKV